jgi:Transposase
MRSATLRWRATGIYWKPVWAVLAEAFELVLANAMHVENAPGRKTDVNDAMWLADLLAHGLIRSSFVPPMAVQARRDLTRSRLVGAVSAVALGTAFERGGTMTAASG